MRSSSKQVKGKEDGEGRGRRTEGKETDPEGEWERQDVGDSRRGLSEHAHPGNEVWLLWVSPGFSSHLILAATAQCHCLREDQTQMGSCPPS